MKKLIFATVLLLLCSAPGFAAKEADKTKIKQRDSTSLQPKDDSKHSQQEQFRARRISYISTEIELIPEEAQLFWPLYSEYLIKRGIIYNENKDLVADWQKSKNKNKDAEQILQQIMENKQEQVRLETEYLQRFSQILPPQKLLKYYIAEESFRKLLLNDLRGNEKK